jgi:hypothetical protein
MLVQAMLPHFAKANKDILTAMNIDRLMSNTKVAKFLTDNFDKLPATTPP